MNMLRYVKLKINQKVVAFCIDDEKLLQKCKAIWAKIENLKKKLNALPVYDDRYIKTKI